MTPLQGLLSFLDAQPYYHQGVWNALLDREKSGQGKDSLQPLCALLKGLMLRRETKDVGEKLVSQAVQPLPANEPHASSMRLCGPLEMPPACPHQ